VQKLEGWGYRMVKIS